MPLSRSCLEIPPIISRPPPAVFSLTGTTPAGVCRRPPGGRVQDRKAQGVDATNQAYTRYDQVHKAQEYHLAEGPPWRGLRRGLPRPDLRHRSRAQGRRGGPARVRPRAGRGAARDRVRDPRGPRCRPRLYEQAEARFSSCSRRVPLEEKLRYRAHRHGSVNQGYFPIHETSDIHPDLVEGWVFCRRAFELDGAPGDVSGFWPRPDLEPLFRRLCRAHERLILPVMQGLLRYLGGDPHLYDAGSRAPTSACGSTTTRRCGRGRDAGRRPPARPRGRGPVHVPARTAHRGPAGAEPGQHEVGAARRAARAASS